MNCKIQDMFDFYKLLNGIPEPKIAVNEAKDIITFFWNYDGYYVDVEINGNGTIDLFSRESILWMKVDNVIDNFPITLITKEWIDNNLRNKNDPNKSDTI